MLLLHHSIIHILKRAILISAVVVFFSCNKTAPVVAQSATIFKTYQQSTEDFPNPERGFYRYSETRAGNYTTLSLTQLKGWRELLMADGGNYKVYSTLVFRYYVLDIFKNSVLSAGFLNGVQADMDIARLAGVKLIPRFTYTVSATAGACPETSICPPYGDAPKGILLQHIAQLKPVLTNNADVIATVQMGFIGIWGENFFTDYFGDASRNGQNKLLDNNWQDRIDVLKALLDAVPDDRMVQVRIPQMKQRAVYGASAPVTAAALTEGEAFANTYKARIGFHNDCFLASADDYGTFDDMGNSATPKQSALSILKPYMQEDSRYVAVGGETCDDAFSPQNDCEPAGMAETEMQRMHYSFLNAAYNNAVNNDWQTSGCMANIKKKLGYRFVLKDATFSKTVSPGGKLSVIINLQNIGYAAPYNPRPVKLILRSQYNGQEYVLDIATEIRKWYTGPVQLKEDFVLPADMPRAKYDILVSMPDKYPSISKRSEYAIQLANQNVWEQTTGYNKLNVTITVN